MDIKDARRRIPALVCRIQSFFAGEGYIATDANHFSALALPPPPPGPPGLPNLPNLHFLPHHQPAGLGVWTEQMTE